MKQAAWEKGTWKLQKIIELFTTVSIANMSILNAHHDDVVALILLTFLVYIVGIPLTSLRLR